MTAPLIVDPEFYDQDAAAYAAEQLVEKFAERNKFDLPIITARDCGRHYGFYRAHDERAPHLDLRVWYGAINWDPRKCASPVKRPGYRWSFTGYKADLTAPGVIAHEMGHHVWECVIRDDAGKRHARWQRNLIRNWRAFVSDEPAPSGYGATSTHEDFAESFKLFLLNPDLLYIGRPRRHAFFVTQLYIYPIVEATWHEVLQNAHEKIIDAVQRWARQ